MTKQINLWAVVVSIGLIFKNQNPKTEWLSNLLDLIKKKKKKKSYQSSFCLLNWCQLTKEMFD